MTEQKTNHQMLNEQAAITYTEMPQDMPQGLSLHRDIEEITADILHQKSQIVHSYIEVGRLLIEAKEQLENGHGSWLKWLSERVDISERMAQHYMRLAREYPNPNAISDLGFTKALALLVLPETQREDFLKESHEINGKLKTVGEMSTRELKRIIRKQQEDAEKSEAAQTFKPIMRDNVSCHDVDETTATNSLHEIGPDLEAAKKHLNSILNYLKEHPTNPSDKATVELRSLHEQIQECVRLAGLETAVA